MSNVSALLELAQKLGADPSTFEGHTIEEAIQFVSDYASGGGGGGSLIATATNGTLDKTWKEIHDALYAGTPVFVRCEDEDAGEYQELDRVGFVKSAGIMSGGGVTSYDVSTGVGNIRYTATSETGYPVLEE